jgi:hypothetical protein
MAGQEDKPLDQAELERLSKKYAIDTFEEHNFWGTKPGRLDKGHFLAIRRVGRFGFYSVWRALPRVLLEKPYSPAYQTFAVRHHGLLLGLSLLTLTVGLNSYSKVKSKN